jgi:DHA1 family multidrug resistance protein-like MFS transporter
MIVSILYVFAWDVFSLTLMRFFHGFGSSMVMPIAMAYAADLAPEGKEGKYMGTMNVSLFLGMGTGPIIGGYLTDYFTISAPFYAMTALVTFSLILTSARATRICWQFLSLGLPMLLAEALL